MRFRAWHYLVLMMGAFYLGARFAEVRYGLSPVEVRSLRQTVRLYEQRYTQLVHDFHILQHDRDVAQAVSVRLQEQNKELLDSQSSLEQQIALYKRILTPSQSALGLSVDQFVVHASTQPSRYAYRILLTWGQSAGRSLTGRVSIVVQGVLHGQKAVLQMHTGNDVFRLQYFQSIVGEWQFPDGFQPQLVELRFVPSSRAVAAISRQFKWEVSQL